MRQNVFYINELEQLKSLSDPLRVKILHLLIEKPYSGQQLSRYLNIPRSKVHYHLKSLEKNGLIYFVGEIQKGNMNEKIYEAVARSYIPNNDLLPSETETGESDRQMTLTSIDRAKQRVYGAPIDSFKNKGTDPAQWSNINAQLEVRTTEEKFRKWVKKYHSLLSELNEMKDNAEDSDWYYVATFGFKLGEPFFKNTPSDSEQ
ncbi:ArsR family transcriptional regulator [Virgibacillus kekensis]|uniref:ArsR family transcriptional regulator n=1 Tax=Virgibacillus kekensis TaxID=202261 RepID=A0ABV9DKJ0_9BACI